MKIDLLQFPEGREIVLELLEEPKNLDIEAPGISITSPIEIRAEALKIQNTLDLNIAMRARAGVQCSRCLAETELTLTKSFRLDYAVSKQDTAVDITEDIRQELMLEYPLKPLCKPDCKGLCPKCGKNLNEGLCNCGGGK